MLRTCKPLGPLIDAIVDGGQQPRHILAQPATLRPEGAPVAAVQRAKVVTSGVPRRRTVNSIAASITRIINSGGSIGGRDGTSNRLSGEQAIASSITTII